MARSAGDGWTRFVRLLRIILPLAALALLSTVFLVARHLNPDDAIPYSEIDIQDRLREPKMTEPVFRGATNDGGDLRVTAAAALPEDPEAGRGAAALSVVGTLITPDGGRSDLKSARVDMDPEGQVLIFDGAVDVRNSAGYRVQTDRMAARMDQTELRSLTPVIAEGPGTHITAQEMVLSQDPDQPGSYVLVFNGDVKLIYQQPE